MNSSQLFWWILRTALPVPLKVTLFTMALHGRGIESIYPGLGRVGHFRSRVQRVVRRHVTELVTMGLLIPQTAREGGHKNPTRYSIGVVALDRYVDRSIDAPAAITSPRVLKAILFADVKPHRKLLMWAIAMYGGEEVSKEQLARTLFRSTSPSSLQQLRRDVAQLADDGFIDRTSRPGAGRGMTLFVNFDVLTKAQMPAPKNHGYQSPPSAVLPFGKTTGTDVYETTGTDVLETTGTNVLRSGTTIAGGDFPRTGTDRKNLSEVIDGQQRPVHAAENSGPSSPLPSHKSSRSTGWKRAASLIYETLRAECYQQLKLAGERGGQIDRTDVRAELLEFAKGWCSRQGVHRFAIPGRRPESSNDIVARVVDDALFLFEASQRTLKRAAGSTGGGTSEI